MRRPDRSPGAESTGAVEDLPGGLPTIANVTAAPMPWSLELEGMDRPGLHVRLFGSHVFFRLWLSQAASSFGDWLAFLAIATLAARVGGGSGGAAVGLVMAARIVPGFFFAPVAGVLIDRIDRKRLMIGCDIGRAIVVVFLPFVDTVLGLVIASLLLEIGTLLFGPAKEASVPNLVPPERLTSANSLSLAAAYGTFPIAAAAFAFLAKLADWLGDIDSLDFLQADQESLAFFVRFVTFLLSAGLIWTLSLPKPERAAKAADAPRIDWAQTFHELKDGWRFIFITPVVRAVNIGLATGLIGGGMVVPLGTVYSIQVLGAGPAGFGVFITALGIGCALGVVTVSVLQKQMPKARTFTIALFGGGLSLMAAGSVSTLGPAALLVGCLGMFAGAVYVLGFTLLHENVDDALRGRIFSSLYTLVRLCLLIAFAIGPFLSELLDRLSRRIFDDARTQVFGVDVFLPGVRLTLFLAGLIIVVSGVLAALALRGEMAEEAEAAETDAAEAAAAEETAP